MQQEKAELLIKLNQINYTEEDCAFIDDSSTENIDIKASLEQWPSAVGWDAIMMYLVIHASFSVVSSISSGFFSELGKDLYDQSKKLLKITKDKQGFGETKLNIEFKDCNIYIYCNTKEDLHYTLENFVDILEKEIEGKEQKNKNITIDLEKNKKL